MTLDEYAVERIKKLEEKVKELEATIEEKESQCLNFATVVKRIRKEIDVYRNMFKKYGDPVSGDWTQESWLNFHISKPYIGSRASDEDLEIYSDFKTIYSLFPVKKKEEEKKEEEDTSGDKDIEEALLDEDLSIDTSEKEKEGE